MAEQIICPTCRSVLLPHGHLSAPWVATPALQILNCPVCATPLSIPADQKPGVIPIGITWDSLEVIQNNYSGISWKDVINFNSPLAKNVTYVGDSNPSLYPTVQELPAQAGKVIGETIGGTAKIVGDAAGNATLGFLSSVGAPLIIGGLIIAYFYFKKD